MFFYISETVATLALQYCQQFSTFTYLFGYFELKPTKTTVMLVMTKTKLFLANNICTNY